MQAIRSKRARVCVTCRSLRATAGTAGRTYMRAAGRLTQRRRKAPQGASASVMLKYAANDKI